jgi:MFS superfamily sulfate permease-like transporter
VLVGVNPVYGLYASIAGPIAGGLAVSTRLMVVTTTTAAALAAGSTLGSFSGADRHEALFVLSVLAGVMMSAAGVLRWGRFTRFVSVSVLTGFLSGVAVNITLGQLGDLLGSPKKGSPAVVKAFNVVAHPSEMSLTAAAVGVSALVLMAVLSRTRIASVASLVALAVPTLLSLDASKLVRPTMPSCSALTEGLFLSGVGPDLLEQLRHTHRVDLRDAVTVIPASETILQSTQEAYDDAEESLAVNASSSPDPSRAE